jgi:hypothetical protein
MMIEDPNRGACPRSRQADAARCAEPREARTALVKRWLDDIAAARKHWEPDFKRMRRNMRFAAASNGRAEGEDDRYRVNLVQRVLKVAVSALYAKNPTVVYKRRPKLDFKLWDGSLETLQQAQQSDRSWRSSGRTIPQISGGPQQMQRQWPRFQAAQALLADVQQGVERRR